MKVQCKCGKELNVPETMKGKKGKCPTCGNMIEICSQEASASSTKQVHSLTKTVTVSPAPSCQPTVSPQQNRAGMAGEKISIRCQKCGNNFFVPSTSGGKKGKCPKCNAIIEIPLLFIEEEDSHHSHSRPSESENPKTSEATPSKSEQGRNAKNSELRFCPTCNMHTRYIGKSKRKVDQEQLRVVRRMALGAILYTIIAIIIGLLLAAILKSAGFGYNKTLKIIDNWYMPAVIIVFSCYCYNTLNASAKRLVCSQCGRESCTAPQNLNRPNFSLGTLGKWYRQKFVFTKPKTATTTERSTKTLHSKFGFNWGAFLIPAIWLLGHKFWFFGTSLIFGYAICYAILFYYDVFVFSVHFVHLPSLTLSIICGIYLGLKGNQWLSSTGRYPTIEELRFREKRWVIGGASYWGRKSAAKNLEIA